MPAQKAADPMTSYLVAVGDVVLRFSEAQLGTVEEQQFQAERINAAPPGPKRAEILDQYYRARANDARELVELRVSLVALDPPGPFATVHKRFLQALDEMVAACEDSTSSRAAKDRELLSHAQERERVAIARWLATAEELRSLGPAIEFGARLRRGLNKVISPLRTAIQRSWTTRRGL